MQVAVVVRAVPAVFVGQLLTLLCEQLTESPYLEFLLQVGEGIGQNWCLERQWVVVIINAIILNTSYTSGKFSRSR